MWKLWLVITVKPVVIFVFGTWTSGLLIKTGDLLIQAGGLYHWQVPLYVKTNFSPYGITMYSYCIQAAFNIH